MPKTMRYLLVIATKLEQIIRFFGRLSANSPFANGCGEVGLVIVLGGVAVAAGDLLIGDEEGVVVVPRANIDEVLAALEGVKANEARLEREVREGATGFAFVKELLNSPATRYVD